MAWRWLTGSHNTKGGFPSNGGVGSCDLSVCMSAANGNGGETGGVDVPKVPALPLRMHNSKLRRGAQLG